jgi:hypothetical protein
VREQPGVWQEVPALRVKAAREVKRAVPTNLTAARVVLVPPDSVA